MVPKHALLGRAHSEVWQRIQSKAESSNSQQSIKLRFCVCVTALHNRFVMESPETVANSYASVRLTICVSTVLSDCQFVCCLSARDLHFYVNKLSATDVSINKVSEHLIQFKSNQNLPVDVKESP